MVITDHHNAPDQIPNADAVINHKQPGCLYEDKNLSGVGVAFKLAQAIWLRKTGEWYREDLDIVALGTVADVVPLVGENRIVVQAGLAKMVENPNIGINALISVAGLTGKQITAGHIGYTLAPRLNAAGRVSHATRAVELLVTTNAEKALDIADELQATNVERQELERHIHEMARQDVLKQGPDAEIYNQLGLCELAKKDYQKALEAFQAGKQIEGNSLMQTLSFNEIVAYEYLQDYQKAAVLLNAYLQNYPDDQAAIREQQFLSTR